MQFIQDIAKTISMVARIDGVVQEQSKKLEVMESKIDSLLERMTRLEEKQSHLRESVRDNILAELKGEIVRVQMTIENSGSSSIQEQIGN